MSNSYEKLKRKEHSVQEILHFHISHLLECVHRRLSFRQKFKNPWLIEATERLNCKIFYEWFKAIEDYSIAFGRETEIRRDKSRLRNVKEYKVVFTHLGTFKFHISQIIGKDNLDLVKVNKTTGANVKIVVSSEKPAVLVYNVKKGHVTLCVNYELYNRYDVLCSF